MWKVLANSTNISQKYRKQFFSMQFVPVFMLGVLFESRFIKFPTNIMFEKFMELWKYHLQLHS